MALQPAYFDPCLGENNEARLQRGARLDEDAMNEVRPPKGNHNKEYNSLVK